VTASGGTGGGVNAINYSDAFAVFNMYGGTITGNMAPNGGAVYTGANIKFTMTGGLITGNVTGKSDDRNTKPTYGAVECPGGAAISGTPQIFGNIWKKDGSELNLYLSNGAAKISVGALTGDASIGVTMAYADTFTTGWNTANSKTPITVFTSDNTKYVVRLNSDSELELHAHDWSDWTVTTAATCLAAGSENRTCSVCGDEETQSIPKLDHSYTYTADGAKITETCSNGCGHSATATVIAPADTTYNGKAIEATVNYSNNWVGQKPEIDYGEHGNVDPGNVTASITVDGVTASVTYTIVREIVPTVVTTPNKNKPAADTENDADENTDDDTVLRVDIPAEAVERGETVILSQSLTAGDTVEITTPGEVTVEIPVENVSATTVAVLVSDDGTEEILKTAKLTDDGLLVTISGDATVQIKDNKKKFVDVADGYWGETAIYFNAAREIFNGTSANTFSPENDTTRQMLMTVLARLSGVNTGSGYDIGMAWAMENNISDGSNPTNTITREQLATMLWRYVGSPDSTLEELDFVDADEVSAYAEEAVRWAVETGILAGKGNGILDPKGNASRAQVAQMLMNFINKQ
jgi:ubiquitin-protein ligase